jgi:hypothetical protein
MTTIAPLPRVAPARPAKLRPPLAALAMAASTGIVAAALGALAVLAPPASVPALLVVGIMSVLVWRRPGLAAVAVIAITPLVAGIDRGRLVPGLRPNEALVVFFSAVLLVRAVVLLPTGWRPSLRLTRLEVVLVWMAVASSFLPIFFMLLRGRSVEPDDVSYAIVLWKYLALYLLVRLSVRSEQEIRWCLWASMLTACIVGAVGFLQALDLVGVRQVLGTYWAPFGHQAALAQPRGGSTVGLPAATADLMVLNLAVAAGLWWKDRKHGVLLAGIAGVCVLGVLAAAEFSSLLGLVIAACCVALALGRLNLLGYLPVVLTAAVVAVWPVVQHRLTGFQGTAGLPVSWTTRLANLETYFWPELFSGSNPLVGVRPSARVAVAYQGTGYVWIESGYTWLLWGGGVPLLAAFVALVRVGCRTTWLACRQLTTYQSVAALAALTGLVVVSVLMVFDPHITYRGSADLLFALFALVALPRADTPDVSPLGTTGEQR